MFVCMAVPCMLAALDLPLELPESDVVVVARIGADADGGKVSLNPVRCPSQSIRPSDTRSLPALTK